MWICWPHIFEHRNKGKWWWNKHCEKVLENVLSIQGYDTLKVRKIFKRFFCCKFWKLSHLAGQPIIGQHFWIIKNPQCSGQKHLLPLDHTEAWGGHTTITSFPITVQISNEDVLALLQGKLLQIWLKIIICDLNDIPNKNFESYVVKKLYFFSTQEV